MIDKYKEFTDKITDSDNIIKDLEKYVRDYKRLKAINIKLKDDYKEAILSDYEEESIKPVLPPKFEDEILNRSCTDMAKKGIAKFRGDKGGKWYKVFKLYSKDKIAFEKVESQAWVTVQPYDPFREE